MNLGPDREEPVPGSAAPGTAHTDLVLNGQLRSFLRLGLVALLIGGIGMSALTLLFHQGTWFRLAGPLARRHRPRRAGAAASGSHLGLSGDCTCGSWCAATTFPMSTQMPGMNGTEPTRAIRRGSLNATPPIVAMTANAFEEDRRICLEAGMDDYIAKPVGAELQFGTALRWLSKGKAQG